MDDFIKKVNELNTYLKTRVYTEIGVQAVKHFKQSFQDEAFSDKSEKDMKWQDVKRRTNPSKSVAGRAAASRKILTGETGDLAESIHFKTESNKVTITNPKIYADVHNKGLRAGRGKGFKMPKRQFIGNSKIMDKKIIAQIQKRINKIMK